MIRTAGRPARALGRASHYWQNSTEVQNPDLGEQEYAVAEVAFAFAQAVEETRRALGRRIACTARAGAPWL